MARALPHPTEKVFTLTPEILAEGKAASLASPRRRIILPVQRSQEARVQRLLNFLQCGTYIQPHCHPLAHATESVCLIEGHLEVLIFSPDGEVTARHHLTPDHPLIDLEPGIWHGMIVHAPDTVIFEVKQGPYDPGNDKTFATWAPAEDSPGVDEFLNSLSEA